MLEVVLPFPISTNALFKNKTRGRAPTAEYLAWQKQAGWELVIQKPERIRGPVSIVYTFEDNRKLDPDNGIKCLNDLLVKHQLIDDDGPKVVRWGSWSFSDKIKGVKVKVLPFD